MSLNVLLPYPSRVSIAVCFIIFRVIPDDPGHRSPIFPLSQLFRSVFLNNANNPNPLHWQVNIHIHIFDPTHGGDSSSRYYSFQQSHILSKAKQSAHIRNGTIRDLEYSMSPSPMNFQNRHAFPLQTAMWKYHRPNLTHDTPEFREKITNYTDMVWLREKWYFHPGLRVNNDIHAFFHRLSRSTWNPRLALINPPTPRFPDSVLCIWISASDSFATKQKQIIWKPSDRVHPY